MFSCEEDKAVSPSEEFIDFYSDCGKDIVIDINSTRVHNGLDSVKYIENYTVPEGEMSIRELAINRNFKPANNVSWIQRKGSNIKDLGGIAKGHCDYTFVNDVVQPYFTDKRQNLKLYPLIIIKKRKDFDYGDDIYYSDFKRVVISFEVN